MRRSLVLLGAIFLVIGVVIYLLPMQEIAGTTTEIGAESSTSARVWSLASALLGIVLIVLGLVDPDPELRSDSRKGSFDRVFRSNDNFSGDVDNRNNVRQRTQTRTTTKEDWDLN